jgi:hypothetical protein
MNFFVWALFRQHFEQVIGCRIEWVARFTASCPNCRHKIGGNNARAAVDRCTVEQEQRQPRAICFAWDVTEQPAKAAVLLACIEFQVIDDRRQRCCIGAGHTIEMIFPGTFDQRGAIIAHD